MDHIQPYLHYFTAHPSWALAIVFIVALGEALLIIGLFVPSTAVLVGAGILVGAGHLGFWPVFIATAFGCIAGDQISYWAGRIYGQTLKTFWPLNKYPHLMAKGENFVREHGGKSIAVGRFVPGVKAVVPGIVGMLGMPQPFFIAVNVSSGLVWALVHLLPGVLIGKGLSIAGEFSGRLVVVLLVLLAILGVAGWLIRILAGVLQPYLHALLLKSSQRARRSKSRAMQRFGKAVAPGNPRAAWLVLFVVMMAVSLVAFIDLLSGAMLRQAASNLDISVSNLMAELRNAPADALFVPLTMMAERPVIWALGLAMAVWLSMWRGWRVSLLILAIMGFAEAASLWLNGMLGGGPAVVPGGFPSTPTLMAGLVFGFLSALAGHAMGRWSKALVAGTCGCIVVGLAFSRVYLGAEQLSGVLAGIFLALVLTGVFGLVIEAIPARRIRPKGLVAFATAAFAIAGTLHIAGDLERAEAAYAKPILSHLYTVDQWSAGSWNQVASRRVDLAGQPEDVFAAQWVGPLEPLKQALAQQGWQAWPVWRWPDAFKYLNTGASLADLPPRPLLHQGLKAKLTMVSYDPAQPNQRIVLRVFKAQAVVNTGSLNQEVYLLSATPETYHVHFHLYALPATLLVEENDRQKLLADLAKAPQTRVLAQSNDSSKPAEVILSQP